MRTAFGSYWIERKVAIGGMAEIFLAYDAHDHQVAIKKIHPDLASQEKFIQMFLDEVRIVIQLNHPHIVQLLDFGLADGAYFFAMEWIDGKSLAEIISAQKKKQGHFPIDVALWMLRDVCAGLHHAHTKQDRYQKAMNLVHRDISPPNIMSGRDGVFKVADFGIAHVRDKNVKTLPGIIRGKFSYMSPEQSLGKELDQRSDIFSTGVVFYELLTGTRLFLRKNEIETLDAVRRCQVPAIRGIRPEVSNAVEELIKKALSVTPANRFRNAEEFQKAAEKILETEFPQSTRAGDVVAYFQKLFPQEKFKERKPKTAEWRIQKHSLSLESVSSVAVMQYAVAHRYWMSVGIGLSVILLVEGFVRYFCKLA